MGDLNFLYLRCRDVNVLFSGELVQIDPVDNDYVHIITRGMKFIKDANELPEFTNKELVYLDQLEYYRYMVYKLAMFGFFSRALAVPAIILFNATYLPLGEELGGDDNLLNAHNFYNCLYKNLSIKPSLWHNEDPGIPWKSLWRMT